MLLRLILYIILTSIFVSAKAENKDSIDISFEYFQKTLATNFESNYNRKIKKMIRQRIVSFKNESGIYLPMLVLSNSTYLASPPILIFPETDSVELKKIKNKNEKEIYFIRKCLDDPEISLNYYKTLLVLYFRDFGNQFAFDAEWVDEKNETYIAFKLCCYHLLSAYFPQNASFRFIIGRWHYNRAVKLINDIDENETEKNIVLIQEESIAELKIALPWFKEAARLYEPFTGVYNKILEELGLK